MIYINNADSPYSEQRVNLGGELYTLTFKFNSRNRAWYLSIYDSSNTVPLLEGLQLKPNASLTSRYNNDNIVGNFWCLRVKNDFSVLDRGNLGSEGVYRLVWLSDEEDASLEGFIRDN